MLNKQEKDMPSRLIIAGTDTNVGKTIVSSLLVAKLNAHYWKPVQCGELDTGGDSATIKKLTGITTLEEIIGLTTIFLPHIFGTGENTNRIIPYLTSNLGKGLITEISQGEQFLPILGVEDCCLAIIAGIPTDQFECSAEPIWYDRVNLLAQIMETTISKGKVEINHEKKSVDNAFPRVEFPQRVKNWSPLLTFEGFISQLVSNGTKIEE